MSCGFKSGLICYCWCFATKTYTSFSNPVSYMSLPPRGGGTHYMKVATCAPPFRPPFFRSLENLYSFDPYILAKIRKMSYFDSYFSLKDCAKCMVPPPPPPPPPFDPCSISSRRAVLHEHPYLKPPPPLPGHSGVRFLWGVQLWGPNPYPILGKAGLRKLTLFWGNLTIPGTGSSPHSKNIPGQVSCQWWGHVPLIAWFLP